MQDVKQDDFIGEVDVNPKSTVFVCPNCGELSRDDVIFLCNTCDQNELVFNDGIYMCPTCLVPGENFQCMKCDSKAVTMSSKK